MATDNNIANNDNLDIYKPEVLDVEIGEEIHLGKDFVITPVKFITNGVSFIYRVYRSSALNRTTIQLGETMPILWDVKLRPLEILTRKLLRLKIDAPRYVVSCESECRVANKPQTIQIRKLKRQTAAELDAIAHNQKGKQKND